jgi:hypothetical protein
MYDPSPGQLQFHEDPARLRCLRACNQGGKTLAGIQELHWWATGTHPYRKTPPPPIEGWIVCGDWDHAGGALQKKIWEWLPKEGLEIGWDWDERRGWLHNKIKWDNGSVFYFKSSNQNSSALASATLRCVWVDEPPNQRQFGEIQSRVAVYEGAIWLTFTPAGRPLKWLRDLIEPKESGWSQTIIRLTPESCPHRSPSSIATQIAGYGPWERAQRVDGAWDGVEPERWFDAFDEDRVVKDIPRRRWKVGIGCDHGQGAGHQTALLILQDHMAIYIADEYVNAKASSPEDDAKGMLEMLSRNGLKIEDVDDIYGDVNDAGKGARGYKVNEILGFHLGYPNIQIPNKRPGSVQYGVRLINYGFLKKQIHVHERCTSLINSLKYWKGRDDDLKHTIDGLRYICTPYLQGMYSPTTLSHLAIR